MTPERLSNSPETEKGARVTRLLNHLRDHINPRPQQTRIGRLGEIASCGGMLLVLDDEKYYGSIPEDDSNRNN